MTVATEPGPGAAGLNASFNVEARVTVKLPEVPVTPPCVAVNVVLWASYNVIPVAVPVPPVKSTETEAVGALPPRTR